MKIYVIDIFESFLEDLIESNSELSEKYDFEFVSYIDYVRLKFNISPTYLSRLLNVSRQTIYNYCKSSTSQLPDEIKHKLAIILDFLTFNEVIEIEKQCLIAEIIQKPQLIELIQNIDDLSSIPDKYYGNCIVDDQRHSPNYGDVYIDSTYDLRYKWSNLIKNNKSAKMIKEKQIFPEHLFSQNNSLPTKNSSEYNALLSSLLNSITDKDDIEFLAYIKKYKK